MKLPKRGKRGNEGLRRFHVMIPFDPGLPDLR